MYNRILVPLDGSELAECTLAHAQEIASGCQVSQVVLLTVVEGAEWGPTGTTWGGVISAQQLAEAQRATHRQATDYIDQVAHKLADDGIRSQGVVAEGEPAESILNYAHQNQVDLILLSSHGRSGLSRWAFGSVADRVVRYSRVPVLTVPPKGCRLD